MWRFRPEMVVALAEQRRRQRVWRLATGSAWQGERYDDMVFSDELGVPLRVERVMQAFKRLLRAAGLLDIRIHDLRHTFATLLLRRGVHPKVVSEALSHSSVSISLDRYSHVLPHMQDDAVRAIGDTLRW